MIWNGPGTMFQKGQTETNICKHLLGFSFIFLWISVNGILCHNLLYLFVMCIYELNIIPWPEKGLSYKCIYLVWWSYRSLECEFWRDMGNTQIAAATHCSREMKIGLQIQPSSCQAEETLADALSFQLCLLKCCVTADSLKLFHSLIWSR